MNHLSSCIRALDQFFNKGRMTRLSSFSPFLLSIFPHLLNMLVRFFTTPSFIIRIFLTVLPVFVLLRQIVNLIRNIH